MCYNICEDCFHDEEIKKIVKSFNLTGECDFCKQKNKFIVNDDVVRSKIATYCQLYIAYNYDECEYDKRFGCRSVEDLVRKEGLFIKDLDHCDNVLDDLFNDNIYLSSSTMGCEQRIKDYVDPRFSICFERDGLLRKQMEAVNQLYEEVKCYLENCKLPEVLFRARIDCDRSKPCDVKPYEGKDLTAPPALICSGLGRADRPYVSFLYLAENIETAIQEVRAVQGDLVSVGKFQTKEPLKVVNLASPFFLKILESSKDNPMKVLSSFATLANMYRRPRGSNKQYIYLPTQLFAEKLVMEGYDGFCFNSSHTGKLTYVIFNPQSFSYVKGSSKLYCVNDVHYEIENV